MKQHTQEPWFLKRETNSNNGLEYEYIASNTGLIASVVCDEETNDQQDANARRIVACVNACEGMSMTGLETFGQGGVKTAMDTLALANESLAKQRDELLAALEKLARLGNGDQYGNSDGNMIARAAIAKVKQ